jgi:hypothetical protein
MQLLMVPLYVPYAGACPAFYAEIFPTRVRYTALSIGYNIAVALFGGFAPFIATFLVRVTDSSHAPAAYVITAAIITLVVLLRTRETAFAPLHLPARSSLARIQARRDCDARKHGKFSGMAGVYNESLMPRYIEMGARFILSGQDAAFLAAGAAQRTGFLRKLSLG